MPTFRRNRMKVYKTNLYFTNVGFVSADYSTDAQQVAENIGSIYVYKDGEDYREVVYNGKACLIIGNEEKGISKLVKENCDFLVTIPISPKIDSLNASVAAGILIYEVVRNRK